MTDKSSHPLVYRADVDGLRAIAVLAVIAFHVSPTTVTGGFVGVDVFFVISGFLISSILIKGLQHGTFSYADFYIRRIRRIFPALVIVFLFTLVAGWLLLLPDEYSQLGKHIAAGSLFVSNFALWSEAGYFDTESSSKPLLHLWSLGIEEQFYIAWPLLLALLWRLQKGSGRMHWVLAGAAASLLLCWYVGVTEPTAAFYLPFARFWQLLVGALLAMATLRYAAKAEPGAGATARRRTSGLAANAFAFVGLALVAFAIVGVDSQSAFPWLRAVVPTLGTAMIIGAGPHTHINRFVLSHKALVFVGLISYPLYLWHWPLLSMLTIVVPPPGTGVYKVAAVVAAFGLATATYLFVEKPVRKPPYVRVQWLVLGSAACLAAGVLVVATAGFAEQRGPWNISLVPDRPEKNRVVTPVCVEAYGAAFHPRLIDERDFCIKDQAGEDDVVVVGDSHANRLFFGLQDIDSSRSYLNLGRGTCLPFLGFDGSWRGEDLVCPETNRRLLERAVDSGAETIVLHAYFVRGYEGRELGRTGNLGAQARKTLEFLSRSGVRTIVVSNVPVMPFHPSTCAERPAIKAFVRAPCSIPADVWNERVAESNASLRAAAAGLENVTFFDPASVLCDAKMCSAVRGDELLYMDSHHLSAAGAVLVARALLETSGLDASIER
jgi:peptidoglycan/LPS O-acetylase OafA/YrhL